MQRRTPTVNTKDAAAAEHPEKRHKRGRRPLPSEIARSERVVTFVTPKERQQLEELADAALQSVSAVCHRFIVRGLQEEIRTNQGE